MVSAIDSVRFSTAQIHLLPTVAREDGVSYRFHSALYSPYSLTNYNRLQPAMMVSTIHSACFSTAQIHLQTRTARGDGVSYLFNSMLYSTDSLTCYNSQRQWCQLSIQTDSLQHRSLTPYNSQRRWCQLSIQLNSLQYRFTYIL
jgi:hypothetical protein